MIYRDGSRRNGDDARSDGSKRTESALSPPSLQTLGALAGASRYARRGVPVGSGVIRVLLVDDHRIFRDGVRALLRSAPDIHVVGEAADGADAVAVAQRLAPDVVVMDLDMPAGGGHDATVALARLEPSPNVLILTMHTEEERLVPLLKDGARGFLSKDCAERELVDAIRVVAAGDFYVRPTVARLLAANAMPKRHESSIDEDRRKLARLSSRERSVLQHFAEGYSGVEIATILRITPKTVDTYKNRIAQKLGFTHRTHYVRFALRLGLIGDDENRHSTDEFGRYLRQPEP
jgi:DNA-binding NarL/FixJ family response regulator